MIKIIKTDLGNRSILLEVANLTSKQCLEVFNLLGTDNSESYACGPYVMVRCGMYVNFDKMLELVGDLQKKFVCVDITYSVKDNEGVSTTTTFSEVEVPLCEDAQDCFYERPTAKFNADIWTDPTYGGTQFTMDSIDDYGWSASVDKFLEPEEVKQIMLGYLEQLPAEGASEENWKAYFCDRHGFEFDTLN